MQEKLFQFIWQYSLYQPQNLFTMDGAPVIVIHPGRLNTNSGPDFTGARVQIGNTILIGNVELHIKTSDWHLHGHESDEAYKNIILHVVYENDEKPSVYGAPLLELSKHIPPYVINQYTYLLQAGASLPCAAQLSQVNNLTRESWLNRMLAERWEQKLTEWQNLLTASQGDWRTLLYWRLAANFGFKVNAVPFQMLAQSIPLNILAKHRDNILQLEALLFGQAGMLNKHFDDVYPNRLKEEYTYLQQKYKLHAIPAHLWKFMRMRPPNFPTVRIAQFAMLVHNSEQLFSHIIEAGNIEKLLPLLEVTASEYWDTHLTFDEVQKKIAKKHLGESSVHNIIINTIAPIQFLYAHSQGNGGGEYALKLLESIPAEENNILRLWNENGWQPNHAAQSQAMLQLYNNYCAGKRCLECAVGLSIIRQNPVKAS